MSKIGRFFANLGGTLGLSNLTKFSPEPRSRSTFFNALKGVGGALGGIPSGLGGVDGEYAALIAQQIEAQKQMQLVSFISNNEKSKHETQMSAIRNIRVG